MHRQAILCAKKLLFLFYEEVFKTSCKPIILRLKNNSCLYIYVEFLKFSCAKFQNLQHIYLSNVCYTVVI